MTYDPPLSGVRILDLSSGPMTALGRLLADLGAQVTPVRLNGVTDDGASEATGGGTGVAVSRGFSLGVKDFPSTMAPTRASG